MNFCRKHSNSLQTGSIPSPVLCWEESKMCTQIAASVPITPLKRVSKPKPLNENHIGKYHKTPSHATAPAIANVCSCILKYNVLLIDNVTGA